MKQKSKMIMATTIAILSLMITNFATDCKQPCSRESPRQKTITTATKVITPPTLVECEINEEYSMSNEQNNTPNEPISEIVTELPIEEPLPIETVPTQPTEKETTDTPPTQDTQTATKPTTPPPAEPTTPKMGDIRIVDGKRQSYFLGFGWVDYMGENECIYEECMYENGNKIGIMG